MVDVLGAIEGAGITEKTAKLAMSIFPPRNLSLQTVVRIKCAGFETLEFMKGRLLNRITKLFHEQNLVITSGMNSAYRAYHGVDIAFSTANVGTAVVEEVMSDVQADCLQKGIEVSIVTKPYKYEFRTG